MGAPLLHRAVDAGHPLTLPADLAERARALGDRLSEALEIGHRTLEAPSPSELAGVAEVTELLAGLPSAEETLALRPSPSLQRRITELLEKSRASGLNEEEARKWQAVEHAEHLLRIGKANALLKLPGR